MRTPTRWDSMGKGRRCKHHTKGGFWSCGKCRRALIAEIQAELPAGETIVRTVYREKPEPQLCDARSPFGYACKLEKNHEGKHFGFADAPMVYWKTEQQILEG